jgi:tetratricopeptide (TPR) repeat protein
MSFSRLLALLLPAFVGIALFVPVWHGDFVYDDRSLISLNSTMQEWSVLGKAFTTPYWELVDESRFASGFYRPLGAATLGTVWQLGNGSPGVFHAVSLLLHGACAAAVAALALALGWRRSLAAAAGLLFAVHGSHAEAVAWISAIPELLATLFSLLALRALALRRSWRMAGWLLAAMLSKEVAIGVWLLAAGITLFRPRATTAAIPVSADQESPPPDRGITLLSLAVAALVVYALRYSAFDSPAAGFDRINTFHGLDRGQQWSLSLSLIGRYLAFLAWPWPHMPFRPLQLGDAADATRLWIAVGGGMATLAALLAWLRYRSRTAILFGLGLLFAGLVPVLNTKALGQYPFEERFLYLPSAGFALLVVAMFGRLPKTVFGMATVLLLAVPNALSAWSGSRHWRTEEELFAWAIETEPNAMTGHIEYGRLMLERAQESTDKLRREMYSARALDAYQRSMDVDPDFYFVTSVEREKGNLGLGDALYLDGDFAAAEVAYQRVVDHYKYSPVGYLGLANCRAQTALGHGQTGHFELADAVMAEALALFETALEQDPHLEAARLGKANALFTLGRFDEALALATGLFGDDPARLEFAQLLFSVQYQMDRIDLAIRTLEYFLEQAPDHPQRDMVQQTVDGLRQMQESRPQGPPR